MTRVGVKEPQLPYLGAMKGAGALGLLAGIAVPAVGIAAAAGLVLFFLGAIAAHLRVQWYDLSYLSYPMGFLLVSAAALALALAEL